MNVPANPIPLQSYPNSSLTIPWAEYTGKGTGSTADVSLGPDGVVAGLTLDFNWTDLQRAVQQLLGFSYRVPGPGTINGNPLLKRNLPFQHPYWGNLWCTRISRFQGVQMDGRAYDVSSGQPVTSYSRARLTCQFTRPLYPVIPDNLVPYNATSEVYEEWVRYCDRKWGIAIQILSRAGQSMIFSEGNVPLGQFLGSIGQRVCHAKLTRRWYQVPWQGLLTPEPGGFPLGLLSDEQGNMTPATVNMYPFLGAPVGTLLYESFDLIEQPLQMPPELMLLVGETYPLQYDVVFHFDYFNPRLGLGVKPTGLGHNCAPSPYDGLWYPCTASSFRGRFTTATVTGGSGGNITVTPVSMVGISLGCAIAVYLGPPPPVGGAALNESVIVTSVTATTFTGAFVGTYAATPIWLVVLRRPLYYSDFSQLFQII